MNLEWHKISTNNPNAWAALMIQLCILCNKHINIIVMEDHTLFLEEDLLPNHTPFRLSFDIMTTLLDTEGIYVIITCNNKGKEWTYRIIKENAPTIFSKKTYDTRAIAHAYATYEAIEYIEKFYTQKGAFN